MYSLDAGGNNGGNNNHLDKLMEGSFWKDILTDITANMDPWSIDIVELSDSYSRKVELMKELNFKIPANVVLVSSILLRMKSDLLIFSGPALEYNLENWVQEGAFLEEFSQFPAASEESPVGELTNFDLDDDVPIKVKPKRVPKRRITALELIAAIGEVLEEKERDKKRKENVDQDIVIKDNFDIEKNIHETYLKVVEILMKNEKVLFSKLARSKEEAIHTLISLLHLSHNKKLKLRQPEIYGEIFIQLFSYARGKEKSP